MVVVRRYHIGRDLTLLREDAEGVELEGTTRLSPGAAVKLTGSKTAGISGRLAMVRTWRIVHFDGPTCLYRGYCLWLDGGVHEGRKGAGDGLRGTVLDTA